jgi:tetratricopeptide (TPR) repeat protein
MWKFRQLTRDAVDEAMTLFYESIQRDPEFAAGYAMAAWCHSLRKIDRWTTDPGRETAEGTRLVRQAVALGQNDALALASSVHALVHLVRDFDISLASADRALALDPNLATAWVAGGFVRIWRGDPDGAIEHIGRGMRLNPLSPDMHRMEVGTALAHLLAGRLQDALSWAERAERHRPDRAFPIGILAAIYARAGRGKDAQTTAQRLCQLDPELRLSNLNEWLPFQRARDRDGFAAALREAGVPER